MMGKMLLLSTVVLSAVLALPAQSSEWYSHESSMLSITADAASGAPLLGAEDAGFLAAKKTSGWGPNATREALPTNNARQLPQPPRHGRPMPANRSPALDRRNTQ